MWSAGRVASTARCSTSRPQREQFIGPSGHPMTLSMLTPCPSSVSRHRTSSSGAIPEATREVPTELVRYPRSSHGLSRTGEPWLLVDRLERIRSWFTHWLIQQPGRQPD